MNPGDIVLVRFPDTDLQHGKLRPALVLTAVPGRHDDLLLAMISSRIYQFVSDFDEIIETSEVDYPGTGLKARSVIRLSRLATVETTVISGRLGHISSERLQTIKERLVAWLQQ